MWELTLISMNGKTEKENLAEKPTICALGQHHLCIDYADGTKIIVLAESVGCIDIREIKK
jgi:hypothetical protein